MTEQRKREDSLNEILKHPKSDDAKEIESLIDSTIKSKHNVYCAGDWHLWIKDKKGNGCKKRPNFDEIIKTVNDTIEKDDLLIYLGDIVDGEFTNKEELKSILRTLSGKKILVLGNNDTFTKSFYKSCGFDYVTQSFIWHNVIFSHMPIDNDNDINVHAHIHDSREYWIPYKNHIDVAYLGGRTKPVELNKLIKHQKEYSKKIKECPEHFNEGYYPHTSDNIFWKILINDLTCLKDPLIDEIPQLKTVQ